MSKEHYEPVIRHYVSMEKAEWLEKENEELKAENERLQKLSDDRLTEWLKCRKAIEESLHAKICPKCLILHHNHRLKYCIECNKLLVKCSIILGEASSEPFTDVKASPKTKPLRCPSCGNNWKNKGGFTLIPNTNEIVCAACLQKFTVKPKV